jgi:hypothetical protein
MGQGKPLGSLKPTLLARKGGARPAMRQQLHNAQAADSHADDLETDLGWNDMGFDAADAGPSDVVPFVRDEAPIATAPVPEVIHQRANAEMRLAAAVQQRRSALEQGRKAAFTLRLDADRHLKLRLACTLDARSAQAVVTEALDRLLSEKPELALLARHAGKRRKS